MHLQALGPLVQLGKEPLAKVVDQKQREVVVLSPVENKEEVGQKNYQAAGSSLQTEMSD